MSQKGPLIDLFPNYKPAGAQTLFQDSNTEKCLKTMAPRNETPPHIKKYRKSYKTQAGVKILHYGVADDQGPVENHIYGKKTLYSDHVNEVLTNPNQGIKELVQDIKEQKYASKIKEPLGKTFERKYNFPNETQQTAFKYGVPTKFSEYTAKEVIFPSDREILEKEENRKQYIKSHGWYEAGEQKDRGYNWPVDKNEFRFGKKEALIPNEAYYILNPDDSKNTFPQTKIVQKNLDDYKNFKDEPLGKPKNLGQIMPTFDENFVFGKSLQTKDPWNAAKCIRGEATYQEAKLDSGLGKSTKFGTRNLTKSGDEDRVFGTPTIRTDILKPIKKSVADPNNYGDEPPAIHLLFPQKYSDMGLTEEDFKKKRTKEDIKGIFNAIGLTYKIGKFEAIFQRAQIIEGSYDNLVSVKAFLDAASEMHHIS